MINNYNFMNLKYNLKVPKRKIIENNNYLNENLFNKKLKKFGMFLFFRIIS